MRTWRKELLVIFGPPLLAILVATTLIYFYVDPAPPRHFVISSGDEDGNYFAYAQQYKELIKAEGINLEVRPSKGVWENLQRLSDPKSDVDVAFVQDGLGTRQKFPNLTSLGSVFYEPIWIFYRGPKNYTRLIDLKGKKIALGEKGGEAHTMAKKLLKASGVDEKNALFIDMTDNQQVQSLHDKSIDVAFFVGTPESPMIHALLMDPSLKVLSLDQAEAITRQFPYLNHLVLPHGALDLEHNIPAKDIDLVSPTAILLVRKSFHPALVYLMMKAASRVHSKPAIFEKRHEFPADKDFIFPLNNGAKTFYQSGAPFWLRYLPFWIATIIQRFVYLVIPLFALLFPILRSIPRFFKWRIRTRIYQRYGELKFLEGRIRDHAGQATYQDYLQQLDNIEDRVSRMRIPLDLTDYVYSLRGHIQFVRDRLERLNRMEKAP